MADIGIVGSGIAGLQLGLSLQQYGISSTIYAERTPEQQLGRRLSNIVGRNSCTRERERQLRVNHWESPPHDLVRLSMRAAGAEPLAFSGRMTAPAQSVDMRIYWARLLEDFSSRGGNVVIDVVQPHQLEELSARHDLTVVAAGRSSLSTMFPRVAEQSPFTAPQRLVLAGLFRGIAYSEPAALEVYVNPGRCEIIAMPIYSFEPHLTAVGIEMPDGGLNHLRHMRYEDDPRAFVAAILDVFRVCAPPIYERIDPRTFDLARPLDLGYACITPTVRRAAAQLRNGRAVMALGDAHIVIDPLTGQGANNASYAASVLAARIREADRFDLAFCERVEREICSYVVPVSDACNARLLPPEPHFRRLLGAAGRSQAVADFYAEGFSHPERFWAIASSPDRTDELLRTRLPPETGRAARASAAARPTIL